MINDSKFSVLFHKYISQTASAQERYEFFEMVKQTQFNDMLIELVDAEMLAPQHSAGLKPKEKSEILDRIYRTDLDAAQKGGGAFFPLWKKLTAVAAAVVLVMGIYFYRSESPDRQSPNRIVVSDVAPGGNRATLTLANGRTIQLSEAKSAISTNAGVLEYNDGTRLALDGMPGGNGQTAMLKASTPKGGTYQVILPDGTHVWLNAASTITYPMAFTGSTRKVEVTGEVYFAVAHDAAKPFVVEAAGQLIEDIGTEFNVNAYIDEQSISTSLVKGLVRVSSSKENVLLSPGQQAKVSFEPGKQIKVIENANIDGIVAWKNGLFKFQRASLQEVMRQLSRWYDLEVRYEGKINERLFTGEITRNVNLSEILGLLKFLDLKFTISQQKQQTIITVKQ